MRLTHWCIVNCLLISASAAPLRGGIRRLSKASKGPKSKRPGSKGPKTSHAPKSGKGKGSRSPSKQSRLLEVTLFPESCKFNGGTLCSGPYPPPVECNSPPGLVQFRFIPRSCKDSRNSQPSATCDEKRGYPFAGMASAFVEFSFTLADGSTITNSKEVKGPVFDLIDSSGISGDLTTFSASVYQDETKTTLLQSVEFDISCTSASLSTLDRFGSFLLETFINPTQGVNIGNTFLQISFFIGPGPDATDQVFIDYLMVDSNLGPPLATDFSSNPFPVGTGIPSTAPLLIDGGVFPGTKLKISLLVTETSGTKAFTEIEFTG